MKKFLLGIGLVIALGSCYNDKFDKLYPTPATTVDLCDTATNPAKFSTNINSIITSKCATSGCHDASTAQSGYTFTTHSADSTANARIMLRAFSTSSPMPPTTSTQLTACEKNQLYYWLNHGSLNN